jgi:hypothetical protein
VAERNSARLALRGNEGNQLADRAGDRRAVAGRRDEHPKAKGTSTNQPGETWPFQAWYRDHAASGLTTNFTWALSVALDPF